MKSKEPRFKELAKAEAQLLNEQFQVAKLAIKHNSEKGTALEAYVKELLRAWLPLEYGITNGQILFPPVQSGAEPKLSPQLDVIIYDALRAAPLVRLPTCDVVPLEAAFAYVEVKAALYGEREEGDEKKNSALRKCLEDAKKVRRHTTRWFWVSLGSNRERPEDFDFPSVRSLVFAFSGPKSAKDFASSVEKVSREVGGAAHFSGAFVGGCGFFNHVRLKESERGERDAYEVELHDDPETALSVFKRELVRGLARFDRYWEKWKLVSDPEVDDPEKKKKVRPTSPYLDHYYGDPEKNASDDATPGSGGLGLRFGKLPVKGQWDESSVLAMSSGSCFDHHRNPRAEFIGDTETFEQPFREVEEDKDVSD